MIFQIFSFGFVCTLETILYFTIAPLHKKYDIILYNLETKIVLKDITVKLFITTCFLKEAILQNQKYLCVFIF